MNAHFTIGKKINRLFNGKPLPAPASSLPPALSSGKPTTASSTWGAAVEIKAGVLAVGELAVKMRPAAEAGLRENGFHADTVTFPRPVGEEFFLTLAEQLQAGFVDDLGIIVCG